MVVCVGATNRPDAVDPALRRPGRFDREFYFPLPDASARAKILEIYTKDWKPPLSPKLIDRVANACVGFGGADMKALCAEAAIRALRRTYPQIYMEDHRLKIDKDKLFVTEQDIIDAMRTIKCSSRRSAPSLGVALPSSLQEPLQKEVVRALERLSVVFAMAGQALERERRVLGVEGGATTGMGNMNSAVYAGEQDLESLTSFRGMDVMHRPRLFLWGRQGDAQGHIARAILQALDPLPVFGIGLQSLYTSTGSGDAKTLEEALVFRVSEARNRAPSVLFLPDYHTWMDVASQPLRSCLETAISSLPASAPVLLLAFGDVNKDRQIQHVIHKNGTRIFTNHHLLEFERPSVEQRGQFFDSIAKDVRTWRKEQQLLLDELPKLERDTELPKWETPPVAVDPAQQDRNTRNMRGMRMKLRAVANKLFTNRKFKDFQLPVLEQGLSPAVRDAYKKCVEWPMDLDTLVWEVEMQVVKCCSQFRERIQLIHDNAIKFNGPDGPGLHTSPAKTGNSQGDDMLSPPAKATYAIPDEQEKILEPGKIIEVELTDAITHELEWVPGKISSIEASGDKILSFMVHFVVNRQHESGSWTEKYKPEDEGQEWRWPAKASKEQRDLDEVLSLQKANTKICSNAMALVDESEEELGKIDTFLIEETEKLVKSQGHKLGPPRKDKESMYKAAASTLSASGSAPPSRQVSSSKGPASKPATPAPSSSAHSSQQMAETGRRHRDSLMAPHGRTPEVVMQSQAPPPLQLGSVLEVALSDRLFLGQGYPGTLRASITRILSEHSFEVQSPSIQGWTAALHLSEENLLWSRVVMPQLLPQPARKRSFEDMNGNGDLQMPGMHSMGRSGQGCAGGAGAGAFAAPHDMLLLGQQQTATQQQQQQLQMRSGAGAVSQQGGGKEVDPTLIQDLVYEDEDFSVEVKDFVQSLIADSDHRTWEQVSVCVICVGSEEAHNHTHTHIHTHTRTHTHTTAAGAA